ncbi:hypothetical protein [Actinokineospora bangkokensis]|uniref:DUF4397 domain-containing protein n=1 Tax=Actinokineospora bangkokensis TaxID=1193682 RepID=A0A1Q9LM70_9PSEU|nr:hypothetical protein [Actinokineospora bangkokensis]OLR93136.1 hypothetical protein BJP25_00645 [Actinokineospora bangkokensis]
MRTKTKAVGRAVAALTATALAIATPAPAAQAAPAADAPASQYTPTAPKRVLDTREGVGAPAKPLGAGATITLDLSAQVPATATSVVLNVTGIAGAAGTYVTAYPTGGTRPVVSNLNLDAGAVRPNAVTVKLGTNRSVDLYNFGGSTHLVADLAGYYQTGPGALYNPVTPYRLADTREAGGPLGPGGVLTVNMREQLPDTATAVVVNVTGIGGSVGTYVTAYPGGAARPTASTLNLAPGQVAPNLAVVQIGTDGTVRFYNNTGTVNLVVDLAGYYDPTFGAQFHAGDPYRLVDTRETNTPLGPKRYFPVDLSGTLPDATALVFNLTGTAPTAGTYLTAWPFSADLPIASNVNLAPRETAANLAVVSLDEAVKLGVYNQFGYVHVLVDVAGWFGPVGAPAAG